MLKRPCTPPGRESFRIFFPGFFGGVTYFTVGVFLQVRGCLGTRYDTYGTAAGCGRLKSEVPLYKWGNPYWVSPRLGAAFGRLLMGASRSGLALGELVEGMVMPVSWPLASATGFPPGGWPPGPTVKVVVGCRRTVG